MMARVQDLIDGMEPERALAEIGAALKKVFPLVADEDRMNFVVNLVGSTGDDKISSMVHL
jgi:hypothetical protein